MASVWPFLPNGEVIEALAWQTDVLRARASEQRQQLRSLPRRTWQFKHLLNHEQHAAARALIRANTQFAVPDLTARLWTGALTAGSSVSVSVDTAALDVSAGDTLVFWQDAVNHEIVTVESVAADAIVLAAVETGRAGALYAADLALAPDGLQLTRPPGRYFEAAIAFESIRGAPDAAASVGYATYRGHDVLPDVPVLGAGTFSEAVSWPGERLDSGTGPLGFWRARDLPDDRYMMRWHAFSAADQRLLRQWIFSRAGRAKAFWRSTWSNDLSAAADLGAADTALRVFLPTGAASLGTSNFDLELHGHALYRRRVTAVAAADAVDGRPTVTLGLDAPLGAAHSAAQLARIRFLKCLRFDADRIEFLRVPGAGVAVQVPLIEVPVP